MAQGRRVRNAPALALAIGGTTVVAGVLLPWVQTGIFGGPLSGAAYDRMYALAMAALMYSQSIGGRNLDGLGSMARAAAFVTGISLLVLAAADAWNALVWACGPSAANVGPGLPIAGLGGMFGIVVGLLGEPGRRRHLELISAPPGGGAVPVQTIARGSR